MIGIIGQKNFLEKLILRMSLNKNSIFAWSSFILTLLGITLILLGVLKYPEYAIGFSVVGIGFIAIGWAFNALKGRI